MDTKTTGWVAYLTVIGLIVAFCAGDKEGARFHLNQSLAIVLAVFVGLVTLLVPYVGPVIGGLWLVFCLICRILGIIAAINQEEKEVPLLGMLKILK